MYVFEGGLTHIKCEVACASTQRHQHHTHSIVPSRGGCANDGRHDRSVVLQQRLHHRKVPGLGGFVQAGLKEAEGRAGTLRFTQRSGNTL
jgi:hypothetical protein